MTEHQRPAQLDAFVDVPTDPPARPASAADQGTTPSQSRGSRDPHLRKEGPATAPKAGTLAESPDDRTVARAVSSALWAAWGDALGFISELTDERGLHRRLGREQFPDIAAPTATGRLVSPGWLISQVKSWPVREPVSWSRRVGGRGGVTMKFPAGTYSDDTQLRLATSRSLRRGRFDHDVFARIELPAWSSYALGGGRASKAAAASMTKPSQVWAANAYPGWTDSGGNGVVMRVAPHAYAALGAQLSWEEVVLSVLRNGIITHGHPRALLPAVAHVLLLLQTFQHRSLAPLMYLHELFETLRPIPQLMTSDRDLGAAFLPAWEAAAKSPFAAAWEHELEAAHRAAEEFVKIVGRRPDRGPDRPAHYFEGLAATGMLDPKKLGAGTGTFIAAYALTAMFADDPLLALRTAANALGSDTDTIATVAGAHLGVVHWFPDELKVQDARYMEAETLRLVAPANASAAPALSYPDLLYWHAPKAQADFVGLDSGQQAVAGLGPARLLGEPTFDVNGEFGWQWLRFEFGQTAIVKRRRELPTLHPELLPRRRQPTPEQTEIQASTVTVGPSAELDELRERASRSNATERRRAAEDRRGGRQDQRKTLTIEGALRRVSESGGDPVVIGRMLVELARTSSVDAAVSFAGLVAVQQRRTK